MEPGFAGIFGSVIFAIPQFFLNYLCPVAQFIGQRANQLTYFTGVYISFPFVAPCLAVHGDDSHAKGFDSAPQNADNCFQFSPGLKPSLSNHTHTLLGMRTGQDIECSHSGVDLVIMAIA